MFGVKTYLTRQIIRCRSKMGEWVRLQLTCCLSGSYNFQQCISQKSQSFRRSYLQIDSQMKLLSVCTKNGAEVPLSTPLLILLTCNLSNFDTIFMKLLIESIDPVFLNTHERSDTHWCTPDRKIIQAFTFILIPEQFQCINITHSYLQN